MVLKSNSVSRFVTDVCQTSRQLDNAFEFYDSFCKYAKIQRKTQIHRDTHFVKATQGHVCMKIVLLFFLLITHWRGVPASWATLHATVCMDI